MLICRMGPWHIESDGHVSARELASLDGLRAVEAQRAAQAEHERARVVAKARELKRRAWRHGHAAGKLEALRAYAGREAAAAFVAHRLEERLAQIVLGVVNDIVGVLPPSAALTHQLRRAVAVAQSQRLVSIRVEPAGFEETTRLASTLEREFGAPLCTVLADAGLPAHSCVVETEAGVIDGGLAVQLRALERGIREGIAAVLRGYALADGAGRSIVEVVEQEVRETLAVLAAPVAIYAARPAQMAGTVPMARTASTASAADASDAAHATHVPSTPAPDTEPRMPPVPMPAPSPSQPHDRRVFIRELP